MFQQVSNKDIHLEVSVYKETEKKSKGGVPIMAQRVNKLD